MCTKASINLDHLGHPLAIEQLEIDNRERLLHDRAQERSLDRHVAGAAEQVTDLRDHLRRDEDRAPGNVQAGERVRAGSVVLVIAISGRNQRTSVADDQSGTPEAFGEQIVVLAPEI